MSNDDFMDFLRVVPLPYGRQLGDNTTFLLTKAKTWAWHKKWPELKDFNRVLVLSDGKNTVVGGVLFYDNVDIQVTILPEYREKGYMSAICKNGILKDAFFEGQKASIVCNELWCFDDFLLRFHLMELIGLTPKNLEEIFAHLSGIHLIDESIDENEFLRRFSVCKCVDKTKKHNDDENVINHCEN